ncbi:MAG: twin-arginine translocation signal domain-containing protein [Betaproteobacteria bacterium]|nr:twin-arginine translocation signal domain-containing protein [Betaproteobacteria bacterium]
MTKANVHRRRFLAAVGLGGAAAAAAVVTKQGGERKKPEASGKQGKGYQLTEHVKKYYETTKV